MTKVTWLKGGLEDRYILRNDGECLVINYDGDSMLLLKKARELILPTFELTTSSLEERSKKLNFYIDALREEGASTWGSANLFGYLQEGYSKGTTSEEAILRLVLFAVPSKLSPPEQRLPLDECLVLGLPSPSDENLSSF
jgi:hypothetical protein